MLIELVVFFCKLSLPSFSVTSIMDVIYGSIICQLSEPLRRSSIPIKQYFYLTNFWQSCQFICMCSTTEASGPIFLRRFRLYVLSFMFRFMFVNICFEKNQNIKIHVMFITKHNMKWNRDLQFLGCLGSQGSREKSSFILCKLCYVKHKHKS